ncbi:MAG: hypothetical protein ACPL1K_04640 [Candidatus Kryptoniota bacterium]
MLNLANLSYNSFQRLVPNLWEYELSDRGKSPDNPYDTYGFDISISLNWDAGNDFFDNFRIALRGTSDFLFEATNGYLLIASATIADRLSSWDSADWRIGQGLYDDPAQAFWPKTTVLEKIINLPEKWNAGAIIIGPEHPFYYRTIVHELGHSAFDLGDEYNDWKGGRIPESDQLDTIMANPFYYSEFSTAIDYSTYTITTNHAFWHGGLSCWEVIFERWGYFNERIDRYKKNAFNRGVQFDLNGNGIVDLFYPINYKADVFGWLDIENPQYPIPIIPRYPISDFINIVEINT